MYVFFGIYANVCVGHVFYCIRVDMDDDDDLDGDIGFEAELALLDEVEADMRSVGEGPEAVSTSTRWSRPLVPSFDRATDALVFQQFDIDYHTGIVTNHLDYSLPPYGCTSSFTPALFTSRSRLHSYIP